MANFIEEFYYGMCGDALLFGGTSPRPTKINATPKKYW